MNKKDRILHPFVAHCTCGTFCSSGPVRYVFPRPSKHDADRDVQIISDWTGRASPLPALWHPGVLTPASPHHALHHDFSKDGTHLYLNPSILREGICDGELIYQYGWARKLPRFFFAGPPTRVALFPCPETAAARSLSRWNNLAPSQRNYRHAHPPLMGSSGDLYAHLFSEMGFSPLFLHRADRPGMILCLNRPLSSHGSEKERIAFFWLGLFSLCHGSGCSEICNLTVCLSKSITLYVMACLGLFSLANPMP